MKMNDPKGGGSIDRSNRFTVASSPVIDVRNSRRRALESSSGSCRRVRKIPEPIPEPSLNPGMEICPP